MKRVNRYFLNYLPFKKPIVRKILGITSNLPLPKKILSNKVEQSFQISEGITITLWSRLQTKEVNFQFWKRFHISLTILFKINWSLINRRSFYSEKRIVFQIWFNEISTNFITEMWDILSLKSCPSNWSVARLLRLTLFQYLLFDLNILFAFGRKIFLKANDRSLSLSLSLVLWQYLFGVLFKWPSSCALFTIWYAPILYHPVCYWHLN